MADITITIEDDGIEIGVGSQGEQMPAATQVEAEAGTGTGLRAWSPLRIAQAIAALCGTAFAAITHATSHATGGADALTAADIGAEPAAAAIQAHVTGTGSPHTAAGVGAPALSILTAAGSRYRATAAGTVGEQKCLVVLAEAGAGGWSPALTAGAHHTVTRSGILTGITPSGLEIGEGCTITITGAFATTTTGITADASGDLDDIAAASVGMVIWREASGYRAICWEKA